MYMAPRTPSPTTIDLLCEALPAGIKQTAKIAVTTRSMKRFIEAPPAFPSAVSCTVATDCRGATCYRRRLQVSAGATRDIGRLGALSPGDDNPNILRSVDDTYLGLIVLKPKRSSLRQQFQIFIRDFFVRHARSD